MSSLAASERFQNLIRDLRLIRNTSEQSGWPAAELDALKSAGGYRWNLPAEFQGEGRTPVEILEAYQMLGGASLVTAFILTQRNAACQRIENSRNEIARRLWLPQLADGAVTATIGISHLTTSRQHLAQPAVSAVRDPVRQGFVLNGTVPWATGAERSDLLVTGGTCPDGTQLLAAIPRREEGVEVGPSVVLLALSRSETSAFGLRNVFVSDEHVLHGPVERVMTASAGGGAGSLATSALALGAAGDSLRQCAAELLGRDAQMFLLDSLQAEYRILTSALLAGTESCSQAMSMSADELRRRANLLAIRAAQVWLGSTKGAGFVSGHPAERAVRESMFFLVWSCPQPVVDSTLQELAGVSRPISADKLHAATNM
ncbi:MAG: acyl-CoA/acyl-ACP dehydrogenase [Planctomyces sp.]|nr:acyl-CoA/acyl-ACP dehydrogenase [Planctomyces sp.]